jgi:anti-sigma regulatory factor (Ser/Thr protein kinase)
MQPARIHIPNVREDERIGSSFNHLIRVVEETNHAQSKVIWDFKDVHFLHPFFLAPLAIFKCQSEKEIRCENISLPMQSYLNNIFFDRTLHFENAAKETAEMVMEQYAEKSYVPLCSFSMTDANKDAFGAIVRDIIVRQTKSTKISTPISYFLGELIDNIYEHSESPNGYLFSQFLEHEGCIDLCIADTGITIFRSYEKAGLFQAEIGQDESEALRMANEGRSTKNRPGAESRGYGISTSKRMLVEGLGGSFFMISGGAFHRYEKNSLNYYAEVKDFFHWNGTLILLRIPIITPDNFNYINYLE